MVEITQILFQIESGDPATAEQLLPLVYDELRRLAKLKIFQESPGQTLQATALVHEAYMRLVDKDRSQNWDSRGHFFAAAAEAMRRILIDNARRRKSQKRGGNQRLESLQEDNAIARADSDDLLMLTEAFDKLAMDDPPAAEVAKLRLFAGLSVSEAANILGISRTTAFRRWKYAQAWLTAEMQEQQND